MIYKVFLGDMQIPTPGEIQIKVKNKNKTITLINEGEVNVLKSPGLTEISFKYIAPRGQNLDTLVKLKEAKTPFQFKVIRPGVFDTDMAVSLEEFTIKDVDKHIRDQVVDIKLKQYRDYKTEKLKLIDDSTAGVEKTRPTETSPEPKESPKEYLVKSGDTLWQIAKKFYGDGSLYPKLAEANGISNPNLIITGDTLTIPVLS